jgi:hypothetical protein
MLGVVLSVQMVVSRAMSDKLLKRPDAKPQLQRPEMPKTQQPEQAAAPTAPAAAAPVASSR